MRRRQELLKFSQSGPQKMFSHAILSQRSLYDKKGRRFRPAAFYYAKQKESLLSFRFLRANKNLLVLELLRDV
jgi:hypothetical protein